MGRTATNLLVIYLCSIAFSCFTHVNAEQYDSVWLWSGVKSQPALQEAKTIYLLQGQIITNYHGNSHFIKQGNPIKPLAYQKLWLVYRAHTLNWSENIFKTLTKQLNYWKMQGVKIEGIQIDFDIPTHQMDVYISFLKRFRQWLPSHYKLSITGLLDWGSNTDINTIDQLGYIIDEVVFQTYQGKQTITNYQQYLNKIQYSKIPFKIGLIQQGEWQAPSYLNSNPNFKGYILFLQNFAL